tara:strand:+ start:389 stop:670 length:282 start_codon:yes stop_codon:yes gene_type:complete
MADKPRKPPFRVGKAKPPKGFENLKKHLDKLNKDFKDATKKLTVHQDPRSKMSASLRSLMDQPRKKVPKSPHKDKKNERRISPKYKDIFKKKT